MLLTAITPISSSLSIRTKNKFHFRILSILALIAIIYILVIHLVLVLRRPDVISTPDLNFNSNTNSGSHAISHTIESTTKHDQKATDDSIPNSHPINEENITTEHESTPNSDPKPEHISIPKSNSTSHSNWTQPPQPPSPPKPHPPTPDPKTNSLIQVLLFPHADQNNPHSDPSTINPSLFHSDENTPEFTSESLEAMRHVWELMDEKERHKFDVPQDGRLMRFFKGAIAKVKAWFRKGRGSDAIDGM